MAWALRRQITEPVRHPKPVLKPRRTPRTKSFPIVWLYPPPQTEPQDQAETLLREIQTHSEHAIDSYVPACSLAQYYGDLAKERGWDPLSWHVIGRELGKLTERVSKRRNGKRFNAYLIPRARV
jgi:hypothetical protein